MMKKLGLRDLIFISLCSVMGMIVKPLLSPMFNLLTDFIRIPGGSVTAGISMLFLVLASVMIGKPGVAFLGGLVQRLVALTTGISAQAGILVLITYSLPGAAIDLVMGLPMSLDTRTRMMLAGAASVLAGAASMNVLYFHMSFLPFILFYIFGILSGGLGGYIAYLLYTRMPSEYKNK